MMETSIKRDPVRVCILTATFHPVVGGGESSTRLLAATLTRQGDKVFVLTQHRFAETPKQEMLDGFEVLRVGRPGLKRWGKYIMMPSAFMKLSRNAKKYDVVYVAGLRTLGWVGMAASMFLGKPCVLRSNSCTELSGDHMFEHLDGNKFYGIKRTFVKRYISIRNTILLKAESFLAISKALEKEYRECGVDHRKIALLPNGVDLSRYYPCGSVEKHSIRRMLGLPVAGKLVTYTGKLNKGKGLEFLLRSWKQISREFPDAHLVLVGSGAEMYLSCEAQLRAYVRESRMESRVTFTGYQENVEKYLQASDVFVMPSESEGLNNSLIEALSCGLPAVVTSVGGMLDIVSDEREGLLVPPKDEKALEAALCRMLQEEDLRSRMRSAALERAQSFDSERIAERYNRFFASIVSGHGVPHDL